MNKNKFPRNVLSTKALKKGLIIGISTVTIGSQLLTVIPTTGFAATTDNSVQAVNPTTVSTYAQFKAAMADKTVDVINLAADIEFPSTTNDYDVRVTHSVTVNGNGHTINTYKNTMNGESDGKQTVTFNDVDFVSFDKDGYYSYYGILKSSVSGYTINLNNVTYTGTQAIYNPHGDVNLSGKVSLTSLDGQENMEVTNLTIAPKADVKMTTNRGDNVRADGNVVIGDGAKVLVSSGHHGFDLSCGKDFVLGENAKLDVTSVYSALYVPCGSATFKAGSVTNLSYDAANEKAYFMIDAQNLDVQNDATFNATAGAGSSYVIKIEGGTAKFSDVASYDIKNKNVSGKAFYFSGGSFDFAKQTVGGWEKTNLTESPSAAWADETAVAKMSGYYVSTITSTDANFVANFKPQNYYRIAGQNVATPTITINPVGSSDGVVTGTTLAGATVTVKYGTKTFTGTAGADGNYSVATEPFVAPGTVMDVTAANKNKTASGSVTVTDNTAPNAPVANKVTDLDTKVTGTAEAGSTVSVVKDGAEIGTAVAGADGKYTVTIPMVPGGTVLSVTATDEAGNKSDATKVTVSTSTIKIDQNITAAFTGTTTTLTATTSPKDAVVSWTTSNSTIATVGKTTGVVTFKAVGTVKVTATLASGAKSVVTIVVTEEKVAVDAPKVTTDVYDVTTAVSGTSTAATVVATVDGTEIGTANVVDGKFTMTIPAQKADAVINFVAKDAKNNASDPTSVTVKAATVKIDQDITAAFTGTTTTLTATTTPKDAVVSWTTSNSTVATVGKTTGVVAFKAKGTVKVTATLASGAKSVVTIVVTDEVINIDAPKISTATIYDNTVTVDGTATAPATKVTAYVAGLPVGTTTVGTDGKFQMTIPAEKAGTVLSFVAADDKNNTSAPTTKTVAASTVKINEDVAKGLVGDSTTLTATTTPAGQAVTWSTSDATIATVNKTTGVVDYKGPGTVTITAALANGQKASKSIVVADLPQPKLSDVTITDTVVNGTIDTTNYSVKQILILVNGVNKTVVNVTDGKFSASVGNLPEGTVIEARYKDQTGNYLTAAKYVGTTVVKGSEDKNISVNGVDSLQKVVTGKTKPNSQVRLFIDGVQKRTSVSDAEGNYTFNSGYMKVGQVVTVELRENSVVTGTTSTIVTKATAEMVLDQPITTSDRYITGKGTPLTSFRLTINGVTKTVKTSDEDGLFSFSTSALPVGTVVKVEMKSAGTYSVSEQATVIQGEVKDSDLTLDEAEVGDTKVTGTTKQPFTSLRLSINGVTKTTTTSGEDGSYTFNSPALKAGDIVKVEMKVDSTWAVSKSETVASGNAAEGKISIDDLVSTATVVTGTTDPNAQVRISLNDATKSIITSGADGKYSYTIGTLATGDVVKAELSVAGTYSVSAETTVKAADVAGGNLVINPVVAADKKVTGTTDPNVQVRISLNGATKSIVTAKEDGTFTYNMSTIKADDVIKAEIKVNGAWAVSKETTVK